MAEQPDPSNDSSEPLDTMETDPPADTHLDTAELLAEPVAGSDPSDLDLKKIAQDYAEYLVVNSKQEKQVLDERVQSVVFRVEEFKQQLDHMHQNITSSSNKMQEAYEHMQQLRELFQRIDQVEAFLGVVSESVDQLDESISRAEKELDPSKIRKVFSVLPKLVCCLSVMELNYVIWPAQF